MENNDIPGVQLVTIKSKHKLYRNGIEAEKVELISLVENDFELVCPKGKFSLGDTSVYIQPDFLIPDNEFFIDFIKPINKKTGTRDYSCSLLGKSSESSEIRNRIRATKFKFAKKIGQKEIVYSNGILLKYSHVSNILSSSFGIDLYGAIRDGQNLDNLLDVKKHEQDIDENSEYLPFPEKIYETGEANIHNCEVNFPQTFAGTQKIDGNSITIGLINGKPIVLSREAEIPMYIRVPIEEKKSFFSEIMNTVFKSKSEIKYKEVLNEENIFIKTAKPYIDILLAKNESENGSYNNFLLRGELNGKGVKGSKNSPKAEETNIKFFGIDNVNQNGFAEKISTDDFYADISLLDLGTPGIRFETVPIYFYEEFHSKEELIKACKIIFKHEKIEGIVINNENNSFSCKIMNEEYDSKK